MILYYLYIELLKIKIYDGVTGQIDYFEILKNNLSTNRTTSNLLKTANKILKTKKEILKIWKYIVKLNPFSDEAYKDYMLYLDNILQDQVLVREESKNYTIIKGNNIEKKSNIYHSMFLADKTSILLVDGYLSTGKILYSSPNFSLLFSYNSKEILNFNIDDLLPNVIQSFHKELIVDVIKHSNIEYKFKKQINSLLKNKNGGICKIKIFLKPVPNLNYGLIYYVYLEKIYKSNFLIILDKDLKINGFSEMGGKGTSFTMELGYNLSHNLYGYHIGLIIPDILPLIIYKNDEFQFIKKDLELKGYLYQVNDLIPIKSKVDAILTKIKNNKNNNYSQFEDCLQNINEEFNDLIRELNKQKTKPFSIFYKIQMFSFLDGKYKYYRINITDDIITGNEKLPIINKKLEESKNYKSSLFNDYKSISKAKISKESDIKKKNHEKIKIIKIGRQLLDTKNTSYKETLNEKNNIDELNIEFENRENSESIKNQMENNEKEEKNKNKKISIISASLSQSEAESDFNKIKLQVINKKDLYYLTIMKYSGSLFAIITIVCFIYNNIFINQYFNDMSLFLESNLIFNMTKMSVAVIYIMVINIKWELNHCLTDTIFGFSQIYERLILENIDYLLYVKNATSYFSEEFKNILDKKRTIKLNIYGHNDYEIYQFNFDNIIHYIINGGINTIKFHSPLLEISEKSDNNMDPLSFGFNE